MSGPRRAWLVIASLLFAGCAAWQTDQPVTPSSYQFSREKVPRTVGKLRRLVALPIRHDAPEICGQHAALTIDYEHKRFKQAVIYLTEHKGYETLHLDTDRYRTWLAAGQNQAFLSELADWAENSGEAVSPGAATQALLARMRALDAADGLLVFDIHNTCVLANPAGRAFFGVFTLGLSEWLPGGDTKKIYEVYRLAILETASSRPVWRKQVLTDPDVQRYSWKGTSAIENLFEDLDQAIPKLLTR